jgi:hypothetical protein
MSEQQEKQTKALAEIAYHLETISNVLASLRTELREIKGKNVVEG